LYVQELRNLPAEVMPAMAAFTKWLSYLLPNFENSMYGMAAHGRAVPGTLILQNTLYAMVYCAIVLAGAAAVSPGRI